MGQERSGGGEKLGIDYVESFELELLTGVKLEGQGGF